MKKPCRLELNNSGSWKLLGLFDAANDVTTAIIMDAADLLAKSLVIGGDQVKATLRVVMDSPERTVIARWHQERGGWFDPVTGGRV